MPKLSMVISWQIHLNKALAQFSYGFSRIYPLKVKAEGCMSMSPWGRQYGTRDMMGKMRRNG